MEKKLRIYSNPAPLLHNFFTPAALFDRQTTSYLASMF